MYSTYYAGIEGITSHPQFDFSIFNESVRPEYSEAGEKKFPLILPTYEVSGVPDMFIGESVYVCVEMNEK